MHTLDNYANRDIDAKIMVDRLRRYRNMTTDQAREHLESLSELILEGIRNYKDVAPLEHQKGDLLRLLDNRARWSDYCCDDATHWAGAL